MSFCKINIYKELYQYCLQTYRYIYTILIWHIGQAQVSAMFINNMEHIDVFVFRIYGIKSR